MYGNYGLQSLVVGTVSVTTARSKTGRRMLERTQLLFFVIFEAVRWWQGSVSGKCFFSFPKQTREETSTTSIPAKEHAGMIGTAD
jgi:hypothetical protein